MILNSKIHKYVFYLLLVLLPTQLGKHFWPEWAIVLGRRVDYLSPTLYVTDVLVISLLFSWSVERLGRIKKKEVRIKIRMKKTFILYSSFFILALFVWVNVASAASQLVSLYKWVKVVEYGLLALYIIKTKPRLSFMASALSVSVFYSSIIAIVQFVLQHSIGGPASPSLGGPLWFLGERTFAIDTPGIARIALGGREFLRSYATFPHPNVLGGYLATILPLLIIEYTNKRISEYSNITQKYIHVLFGFSIISGIIALGLTFSRSAWVVFLGALCVMRYALFVKRKHTYIAYAMLFAVLTLTVFLITGISTDSESVVVRQQLNTAAVTIWRQSPVFGVGLGNFLVTLPAALPSRQIYFLQPVHNIYLLLLAETGVVGIVVSLLFILFVIKYVELRSKNKELIYNSLILISLFSILALGLVDHYPLTLQQGQLLLTVLLSCLFI